MRIKYELSSHDLVEFNACIVCGHEKLSHLASVKTLLRDKDSYEEFLVTSHCNNCGHVFRSAIPSENWFISQFNYRHQKQLEQGFIPINDDVEVERLDRYRQLSRSLVRLTKEQDFDFDFEHVVDFGCGTGTGLQAWKDLGVIVRGVDPDESRANHGIRLGHDITISTWQDFTQKIDKNVLITSIQSLEHFYEPKKFLKHVRSLVDDGALLYVEVPDADHFAEDWNDSLYLAHVSNFTLLSLVKLLDLCGFVALDRVRPYDSEDRNDSNLCVLAVAGSAKSALPLDSLVAAFDVDDWGSTLSQRYSFEAADQTNVRCNVFHVPEVNDLSLAYKQVEDVKNSVRKNYELRNSELKNSFVDVT